MAISNCEFQIANLKCEIRHVKSRRRRGVSILEVIFAILVTTIGLLAALTVFPVSAALARKGRIADETAIAGKAAFHAFDTRGMRRPDMWQMWDPTGGSGFFIPVSVQPYVSYCIDPRFVSSPGNLSSNAIALQAEYFPYVPPGAGDPRMYRITLLNAFGGAPMSQPQAHSLFTFNDDYTLIRPSDGSLPAHGSFKRVDHDNDDPTLKDPTKTAPISTVRNAVGHLTWMATLVPKHELYAPTNVVLNDQYVLSVVVFHDRPLVNLTLDLPGPNELYQTAERVVGVNFADAGGLGYAGGETLLIWPPTGTIAANQTNYEIAKQQMKVRAGDWIMLAGLAPRWDIVAGTPTVLVDVPVFKWYRVTEADHEPEYHTVEQHYEVAVSLAGQDWDTTLADQRAFLITGVVGVFEKTVRLETGVGF